MFPLPSKLFAPFARSERTQKWVLHTNLNYTHEIGLFQAKTHELLFFCMNGRKTGFLRLSFRFFLIISRSARTLSLR